jgi:hypothetical protein
MQLLNKNQDVYKLVQFIALFLEVLKISITFAENNAL